MYEADCIFSTVSWQTVREAQKQTVCGRLLCFYDERKHSECSLPVFIWKQRILQAYALLRLFFNLFTRIGMPQSRRHMAASEKNSICQNRAVCFYVLCFYQNLYGLYAGFFVCILRESPCILAKVHKFRTNSFWCVPMRIPPSRSYGQFSRKQVSWLLCWYHPPWARQYLNLSLPF